MGVKIFILGLPGSGKSEVARNIDTHVKNMFWSNIDDHWRTKRFNDYPILDEMSKDKIEGKLFQRLEPVGFNVLDIVAFDIALPKLELRIGDHISSAKKEEIILIEFARKDYWRALKLFQKSFVQDAYFIYLGVDVEECKRRIRERIANPLYPEDDYPVSDYIFETYYYGDDGYVLTSFLQSVYEISDNRILMLNNNFSLEEAMMHIEPFIDGIIKAESTRFSPTQRQTDDPEIPSLVNEAVESDIFIEYSASDTKIEETPVPS
jgi:adenylate kinase family enzyme